LCPHIAIGRHRRAGAERPNAAVIPPGSHGEKPDGWTLGITRRYETRFFPEHGFTAYLPAPFPTVREFTYDAHGALCDFSNLFGPHLANFFWPHLDEPESRTTSFGPTPCSRHRTAPARQIRGVSAELARHETR
jgi:hypothetical protein